MKSASTTLHRLLGKHPSIAMSNPKEPCYFVDPATLKTWWPGLWRKGYWQSEQNYLDLFPHKPNASWFGESSTDYSKLPHIEGVVEKIATYDSDARILYIMRDPVQRTLSHYWHNVRLQRETRSPMAAISQDPEYRNVSHYALQLAPYFAVFGQDQVHILTFEELTADPVATVQAIYRWLEVDDRFVPPNPNRASNANSDAIVQVRPWGWRLNRIRQSKAYGRIRPFVPHAARRAGVSLMQRELHPKRVDVSAVEDYLRRMQLDQVEELTKLTGRAFPEWKTLYAGGN